MHIVFTLKLCTQWDTNALLDYFFIDAITWRTIYHSVGQTQEVHQLTITSSASCSLSCSRAYLFGKRSSSMPEPRGTDPWGTDTPGSDDAPPDDKRAAT